LSGLDAPLIDKEDDSMVDVNESELMPGAVGGSNSSALVNGSNAQRHPASSYFDQMSQSAIGIAVQKDASVLRIRANHFNVKPNAGRHGSKPINLGMAQ